MKKKTYAVMGATGQIGQGITRDLLKKGHKVRALGRDQKKLMSLKKEGADPQSVEFDSLADLTKGFTGAEGVFCMIPPSYGEEDFVKYQDKVGELIYKALEKSKVHNVIFLSSVGAQHAAGTGPIAALHRQEQRISHLPHINAVQFRASYFMQNFLWSLDSIHKEGAIVSAIQGNIPIPMVSTVDIGHKVADLFDKQEFKGSTVCEFVGPEGLTMEHATQILSKAYGKTIRYVALPPEDLENGMIAHGMNPKMAKLMVEMHVAVNTGKLVTDLPATLDSRGTTRLAEFARQLFSTKNVAAA